MILPDLVSYDINADIVQHEIDRLQAEYGDVPIETHRHSVSSTAFEEFRDIARDGYVGGAYVWVVRSPEDEPPLSDSMPDDAAGDRQRVLMILNRGDDGWGLAGGGREDGETFEDAAIREVEEETNITCTLSDLFFLRHSVTTTDDRDERLHTLFVFFDGRYEDGEIAIQGGELNGAAWFAEPPSRMLPANERRAETWFETD